MFAKQSRRVGKTRLLMRGSASTQVYTTWQDTSFYASTFPLGFSFLSFTFLFIFPFSGLGRDM